MTKSFMMRNWPRAIAHVDADAFFVSVEQALNPELKGRPVVTGAERGIVTAASYEAKALGIKRGMTLSEVSRTSPECIMLQSDYENYAIFSERIFSILRKFSPAVEKYSIDEGFLDLTGTRRLHRMGYGEICQAIQNEIHKELDITVSVGVSLSKSTAKLSSKFRKPFGLTIVRGRELHLFLQRIALSEVWGFGPSTSSLLQKYCLRTAFDFTNQPVDFAKQLLGKVGEDIWGELRGEYIYKVNPASRDKQASISKFGTFTPPTSTREVILAYAIRNLENACAKARRLGQVSKKIQLYLKGQDFSTDGLEFRFSRGSSSPTELTKHLVGLFESLFRKNRLYRATGVVLSGLSKNSAVQFDMFERPQRVLQHKRLFEAVDKIDSVFGRGKVFISTNLSLPSSKVNPTRNVRIPLLH